MLFCLFLLTFKRFKAVATIFFGSSCSSLSPLLLHIHPPGQDEAVGDEGRARMKAAMGRIGDRKNDDGGRKELRSWRPGKLPSPAVKMVDLAHLGPPWRPEAGPLSAWQSKWSTSAKGMSVMSDAVTDHADDALARRWSP